MEMEMEKDLFYLFLLFLRPNIAEICLYSSQACGNMGLSGVFLGIYYNRNIVYMCLVILLVLTYYGYFAIGLGLFLLSILKYFITLKKWYKIIQINL
jgi:hypothetical protein